MKVATIPAQATIDDHQYAPSENVREEFRLLNLTATTRRKAVQYRRNFIGDRMAKRAFQEAREYLAESTSLRKRSALRDMPLIAGE